jgi:hypothetical protein
MVALPDGRWRPLLPPVIYDLDPVRAVPCGYTLRTRPRRGLTIAGGVVFGLTHVAAVISAALIATRDPTALVAVIPVAGPLVGLSRVNAADSRALVGLHATFDSLGQAAGLGMLIAGAATREQAIVRSDLAAPRVLPVPMALGRAGAGLGLAGTF